MVAGWTTDRPGLAGGLASLHYNYKKRCKNFLNFSEFVLMKAGLISAPRSQEKGSRSLWWLYSNIDEFPPNPKDLNSGL